MPSTVTENRIVEMSFDNKQFEEGVKTSLSTLEKLKLALKFEKTPDGLENLNKSIKKVSFDGINSAIETVQTKFSTLQIIGVTALMNITNSAIEAGKRITAALTINPMRTGFAQYESKIKSMNVLTHALEGRNTEQEINDAINDLYTYANKTIYNPANMVDTLSKLANASKNYDAKQLTKVIQGFGNMAAMSGAGAQEFNRGVYNLSQAISTGKMMAIDWKSFENANLATNELKDKFIETAVALGTLDQKTELYQEVLKDFRGTLQKGWLTSDVMLKTFMAYADETTEFGKAAVKAGQRVKNFSELIDALGESVTTGWALSLEYVLGDMHELSDIMTIVSNIIGDQFLGAMADSRNAMLREWKDLGGRADLIDALANAFLGLMSVLKPIKTAFREIFPPLTGQRLADFTKRLKELTSGMVLSDRSARDLHDTFKGLFSVVKLFGTVAVNLLKMGAPLINVLGIAGRLLLLVTGYLGRFINNLTNLANKGRAAEKVLNGIRIALTLFVGVLALGVLKLIEFADWVSRIPLLKPIFEGAAFALNLFLGILAQIPKIDLSKLPKAFNQIKTDFFAFLNSIRNQPIISKALELIGKAFEALKRRGANLIEMMKTLKTNIGDLFKAFSIGIKTGDFSVFADKFMAKLRSIKEMVTEFLRNSGVFGILFNDDGSFRGIDEILGNFVEKIREFTAEVTPAKFAAFAFSLAFLALAGSISSAATKFGDAMVGIKGFFTGLTKVVKNLGAKSMWITNLANGIALVAGALMLMTLVDQNKLVSSAKVLGIFVGGLMIFVGIFQAAMAGISKINEKFDLNRSLSGLGRMMAGLAASAILLAAAFKIMDTLDTDGILKKATGLGLVIIALGASVTIMSRFAPELKKGSLFLLAFAASTALIVNSIAKISSLSLTAGDITKMIGVMISLGVLAHGMGSIKFTTAVGLLALIKVLEYAIPRLNQLVVSYDMTPLITSVKRLITSFANALANLVDFVSRYGLIINSVFGPIISQGIRENPIVVGLTVMAGAVYLAMRILDHMGKAVSKIGIGIFGLVGALYLLTFVAERFKEMNLSSDQFDQVINFMLGGIAGIALVITAMGVFTNKDTASPVKFAALVVAIAGAMAIFTAVAKKIAGMKLGDVILGFGAIAVIMGGIIGMIHEAGKAEGVKTLAIISLLVGVQLILAEVFAIAAMSKWNEILKVFTVSAILSGIMLAFGGMIRLANQENAGLNGLFRFLGIAAVIASLAGAIYVLKDIDVANPNIEHNLAALGGAVLLLATLSATLGRIGGQIKPSILGALGIMSGCIVTLAGIFYLVKDIPWGDAAYNFAALNASLLVLVGSLALFRFINQDSKVILSAASAIAIMSGSLLLIAASFMMLANYDWKIVMGTAGSIILVLTVMATLLMALMGIATMSEGLGAGIILAIGAAIAMLGASVMMAGAGMVLGATGLKILLDILESLTNYDLGALGKNIAEFAEGMMPLAKVGVVLIPGAMGFIAAGAGLILLTKGILAFTSVKDISNLPNLVKGLYLLSTAGGALTLTSAGLIGAGVGLRLLATPLKTISTIDLVGVGKSMISFSSGAGILSIKGFALSKVAPKLGKGLITLAKGITSVGESIAVTSGLIKDFSENGIPGLTKSFNNAGMDAVSGLIEGIQNRNSALLEGGMFLGTTVLNGLRVAVGWHSPWTALIEAGKDAVAGLIEGFKEGGTSLKEKAGELLGSDVVDKITEKFSGLKTLFVDYAKNGNINEGFSQLISEWVPGFESASSAVSEFKEQLGLANDEASDFFSTLQETVSNQLDIFSEFSKKTDMTSDQIMTNMISQINGIAEWADDIEMLGNRGINEGLLAYLAELGPQGYEYVNAFVTMSEEQLEKAGQLYQNAMAIPSGVSEHIKSTWSASGYMVGEALPEGTAEGIKANQQEVTDAITKAAQATEDTYRKAFKVNSPSKLTIPIGEALPEGIAVGIKNHQGSLYSPISMVCSTILNKFKMGLSRDKFSSLANNVMSGLSSGLRSNISVATSGISQVASNLISTAKNVLGIHSPSREFAEIAKYSMLGFANGIDEYAKYAKESTSEAANGSLDSMRDSISYYENLALQNLDLNPVIRPTLDLSEIESGRSYLDSILGNDTAMRLASDNNVMLNARESDRWSSRDKIDATNTDVVNAIRELRTDVNDLKTTWDGAEVVMDSGALVGELSRPMDQSLGTQANRNRREKTG